MQLKKNQDSDSLASIVVNKADPVSTDQPLQCHPRSVLLSPILFVFFFCLFVVGFFWFFFLKLRVMWYGSDRKTRSSCILMVVIRYTCSKAYPGFSLLSLNVAVIYRNDSILYFVQS